MAIRLSVHGIFDALRYPFATHLLTLVSTCYRAAIQLLSH
uniref:Uncharacterized protein n=1 Tax=Vibrio phage vB_VpP_3 TaxID=3158836 RepID=A0AAU7L288_9CAUD